MSSPHLHVTGELSTTDREAIERAMRQIDDQLGLSVEDTTLGEPWVVIAHDLTNQSILFASRRGINTVFSGQDAEELANSILEYAEQ
jgi:hypothetical protein